MTAITFLLFSTAYRGRGTQSAVIAPSRSEAIPPTFLTSDAQHIELADEIAEDDGAVAGH